MSTAPMAAGTPFSYRAQTPDGSWVTGTIDAGDADEARLRLAGLGLRVFQLDAAAQPPPRAGRLSREDFVAFNQQLAQLTAAGMPIESGLRLIAHDMRSRRMARAVQAVAEDLEHGLGLPEAFARHSAHFPALYGHVLEAGIQAGNLPGVLLNLGRHLELMQRLRRNLWRAASYPLMALLALCAVLIFIGYVLAGPIQEIFLDIGAKLPWVTRAVFAVAQYMPLVLLVAAAHVVGLMALWRWSQIRGYEQRFIDRYMAWLPLIGRVIRSNLVARWCGAVGLGVEAGLDLPRAVELAGRATGSRILEEDGRRVLAAHEAGEPLQSAAPVYLVPPTVLAAMEFGRKRGDLAEALRMLSQMYARQSENHLATAVAVLSPLMLLFVAALLGVVIAALFLPVWSMLRGVAW